MKDCKYPEEVCCQHNADLLRRMESTAEITDLDLDDLKSQIEVADAMLERLQKEHVKLTGVRHRWFR